MNDEEVDPFEDVEEPEKMVLAEKGGDVVMKERLQKGLQKDREWVELENGRRYQSFVVPPTFLTFLNNGAVGELTELRELFAKNGVDLADNDTVFFYPRAGFFAVEASSMAVEMVEGIFMAAGQSGPSPVLAGCYTLVESTEKLEGLEKGDFKILRQICVGSLPGQVGKLKMRRRFLELEFEGQTSGSDDFVESRARILAKRKEALVNESDAGVGVPIILQQEKVGDHWQTRVGTFSARSIEDRIKEGR
jgi:hypothetical protein